MKQFLWWWWPTIGYAVLVAFFAWTTWNEVSHHYPARAGWMTAIFLFLMVREVRRTRAASLAKDNT